jgi:hypothetical protein
MTLATLSASERTLLLAVFTLAAQAVQAKMRATRRATAKASRAPAAPGIGAISQSTGALPSLGRLPQYLQGSGQQCLYHPR